MKTINTRHFVRCLLLFALSLLPLQSVEAQTKYDEGISRELAEYRKQTIYDLRYTLSFSIPERRNQAITGKETIRFRLDSPTEVILDFRASPDYVKSVKTNGITSDYKFQNEHIIIPVSETVKGENVISISFRAGEQSLNRNDDFMYTLFVPDRARTAFPCFDQPDLKARYTLSLQVPKGWKAVSNTNTVKSKSVASKGNSSKSTTSTVWQFAETEPLSTYLFAFSAGRFDVKTHTAKDGRKISAYYRETDPRRVEQLSEIFRQVEFSLKWQEDFTGVKYPFAKYDLVILPGFQFGGMEHTGATFYNDNTIFLSEHATTDEILARSNLIAHETTHMWFGDYVTMRWFDDVWTKEVFANYFAAEITAPQFPMVNHDLNNLKTYVSASLSEDRTWDASVMLSSGELLQGGGTSIRQPLDNLRNAGLIYNNIIYNKAPLMLRKLVEIMGKEAFRESIREYVQKFAYSNANWDELVEIFDAHTSADIKAFSKAWVNEKGMPHFTLSLSEIKAETGTSKIGKGGVELSVVQSDPYGRGITWPQSFAVSLLRQDKDTTMLITLEDTRPNVRIELPSSWAEAQIIPNSDGRGYGVFSLDAQQQKKLLANWNKVTSGTCRQSVLLNLHELYLLHAFSHKDWLMALIVALGEETDPLTASTICSYLREPLLRIGCGQVHAESDYLQMQLRNDAEDRLLALAEEHSLPSVRIQLIRLLAHASTGIVAERWLYDLWDKASHPLLSERDYMSLSMELALRCPQRAESIIARQAERLSEPLTGKPNPDRIREYSFVSRAVLPYTSSLDSLFSELLIPENRRVEPWAASVLAFLNHPLREHESVKYIRPALEALEDVQRTGDIFFPANWCKALLAEHYSKEARQVVEDFLNEHPDYLILRRNKILNGAYGLFR